MTDGGRDSNFVPVETARMLLEAEQMGAVLAEMPVFDDCGPVTAELVALWIKPARHFNAYYKVSCGGNRPVHVSAFLLSPERADRVVRRATRGHRPKLARKGACPHCGTYRAGEDLVLQAFPLDYRLPTLAECLDPKTLARASGGEVAAKRCDPVAYRPGMRCQIRIQEQGGAMSYGKVSVESRGAGRGFELHRRAYSALANRRSPLRVAVPKVYLEDLGISVVAGMRGKSYHELLRDGVDLTRATELVAQAAHHLHSLDTKITDRAYNVSEEIALAKSWVDLVAELCPQLTDGLRAWHESLCVDPPPDCSARAVLHRDFYDKQVLINGEIPVLLDMDTICAGDAELDIGNFRAHLYLRGLQWNRDDRFAGLEQAFVGAYPGLLSERRMLWYRGVALLRLACGYALRPQWRHLVPAMIEEAGP